MIIYTQGGDMFEGDYDVLINTVNCDRRGVMGAGVALEFRTRFPLMFASFRAAAARGEISPGRLHTWRSPTRQLVVNFPTKVRWEDPSEYDYIAAGLGPLRELLASRGEVRVAVPPLGCGNGKLDWRRVRPMIEAALGDLPARITVFEPRGAAGPHTFLPVTRPAEVTDELRGRIVAATGHRPDKLSARGESPYSKAAQARLVAFVRGWLEALRPLGTVSGMALGLDVAIAQGSRDLSIPYLCAIPFEGFDGRWPEDSRRLYRELLSGAAKVVTVSPGGYSGAKMMKRNAYMVDTALNHRSGVGLLFSLYNGSGGGTGNTVEYATRVGLPMINAWEDYAKLIAA